MDETMKLGEEVVAFLHIVSKDNEPGQHHHRKARSLDDDNKETEKCKQHKII
jgi:hypothetical protein